MGVCESVGGDGAVGGEEIIMLKKISIFNKLVGKKVLVRLDLNVPLKNRQVMDNSRLKAAVPTIQLLRKKGAKIIIVSHLGRPEGKVVEDLKLDPVVKELGKLLKLKIAKLETGDWKFSGDEYKKLQAKISSLKNSGVVMLDNIRFASGEEKNDLILVKQLAGLADLFVFDGFAVAHRAAASVVGVTKYLSAYAGLLMEKEVTALEAVIKKPKRPLLAIMGGAKLETKVPVLQNISRVADAVLVGGGIVNTFLLSLGYEVGASLVDEEQLVIAKKLARKKNIFLPLDVVVGTRDGKNWRVVEIGPKPHQICGKDEAIFDLGPATIERLRVSLPAAKTIVWNGALGYFEQPPYNEATDALAKMLAAATRRKIFTVVGGGETLEVLAALNLIKKISFVSTAGGAMLEFLAGKKLPGLKVLEQK